MEWLQQQWICIVRFVCVALCFVILCTIQGHAQAPPMQGLSGYWNFDEDSGNVAHDISGNQYNGTVTNAAWIPGKINSALAFNGTSGGVVTPNIPLGGSFSLSAWVNPAVAVQRPYARIAETQYNSGFYVGTNSAGTKYKVIVNTGFGSCTSISYGCAEGGVISSGWHLVVATYDGTTARLYVDNSLVASDTFTTPPNESYPLYIGRYYGGSYYDWNGGIDEVRLYKRALTATEISNIYNSTGASDTTPPTTPTNVSAVAVSSVQINVTWAASTDNVGVAGYQVYRNGVQVGTTPTSPFSDNGLTPSTTYSYTVAAYDSAGNVSAQSTAAIANTPAATTDTTPPTIPTNVTATAVSSTQVNLTWSASTDNVGVSGYQVYRNGVQVGTTPTSPFSDKGLTPSTTYSYTVAAYDSAGNISAQSTAGVATTPAASTSTLTISIVSVDVLSPTGATITWTTNEVANSQLLYGFTTNYGSGPVTSSKLTTAHAITISGLTSSTTYHFKVQSTDAAGNVAASTDQVFTTPPNPSWPVGWTQLPNTLMQNVCPPDYFNGQNYAFHTECYRLIVWGGTFGDTRRNRMLIWGGGHDNYYGNEIYSLNLNANPVTLTRLNNPSPIVTPGSATCPTTLSDGNPNARETQNNLAYIANLDLMFSFNGGLACGNGYHYNDTWVLNPSNLQWTREDPVNGPITPATYGPYYANSGYNPSTQTVFTQWADTLFRYSYTTNTYTELSAAGYAHFPYASTGVIDPKRQLFIAMGAEYQSTAPHVYVIDLSGVGSYASVEWTSQVTGCDGLASSHWPGMAYDYALDRIVGYPNQGNTVYIFDPDTKTCTTQTYANGPQNTPDAVAQGTFGRFQYFPGLDAFAIVNAVDDDAYILRVQ